MTMSHATTAQNEKHSTRYSTSPSIIVLSVVRFVCNTRMKRDNGGNKWRIVYMKIKIVDSEG
jgi:hypothetical protein